MLLEHRNTDIKAIILFINSPVSSLSDSRCFGKVCEESHRALQGWLGSAEHDGLHPERGALDSPTKVHVSVAVNITQISKLITASGFLNTSEH